MGWSVVATRCGLSLHGIGLVSLLRQPPYLFSTLSGFFNPVFSQTESVCANGLVGKHRWARGDEKTLAQRAMAAKARPACRAGVA